jgi:hypothetical protein
MELIAGRGSRNKPTTIYTYCRKSSKVYIKRWNITLLVFINFKIARRIENNIILDQISVLYHKRKRVICVYNIK